jgi:hypothetical protein
VNQKKYAHGKDEYEWTAEQPKVQMKIPDEPVKSRSHTAGALSEFENQSSPWKNST